MNLILVERHQVSTDATVTLRDEQARHVLHVLKARPGSCVRIGIVNGAVGLGTIVGDPCGPPSGGPEQVVLQCVFDDVPPRPRVDLLLALPRPKVMRRVWAQLAALGVGRIILTNAARVERNYFDTHVLTPECYRPLLIEGLQQARDTHLPQVTIHRQFRVVVEDELDTLSDAALRVVADPRATAAISEVIASKIRLKADTAERVLLAVGPEGGWNDFELSMLAAHGFQCASMGPRTLRTDTACVVLLGLVQATLES